MLDRLYTVFDQLSREHQVFKVETIGDACTYFCTILFMRVYNMYTCTCIHIQIFTALGV